jgi:hypothetical protein
MKLYAVDIKKAWTFIVQAFLFFIKMCAVHGARTNYLLILQF